jgi:hypothetical protein
MNAPETLDERLAARFSVDRAKKLRAEAEEARAGAEALARELADADKSEAAMRAMRECIGEMVQAWRVSLPAEMAALESQDAIHARLASVVHEGLATVSAQAQEMARALAGEPGSAVDSLVAHGGVAYLERLARSVAPRPHLTVSTWADKYRWLSQKGSSEPGKWKTERNPMLREIMDCLSVQSDVRRIVVMKPAQVGVTEACLNWIGYVMQHAPAPIMVLLPTLENRDKWIGQKLNPLLLETPIIAELFDAKRERDASNSRDNKDFPGGVLFLAGGNSPNSYAQVSARYVILDDADRFPEEVGAEGHPVALARNRCKAFPRYKMLLISTPTIKEASHIEAEYDKSDQRRYHVPCPHCGEFQVLEWKHLKWPDHCVTSGTVTNAWYVCPGQWLRDRGTPQAGNAGARALGGGAARGEDARLSHQRFVCADRTGQDVGGTGAGVAGRAEGSCGAEDLHQHRTGRDLGRPLACGEAEASVGARRAAEGAGDSAGLFAADVRGGYAGRPAGGACDRARADAWARRRRKGADSLDHRLPGDPRQPGA